MSIRHIFILLLATVVAGGGCWFLWQPLPRLWVAVWFVAVLLEMLYLFKSSLLPIEKATVGFDLIKSQDASNRLRKVGQKNADTIVEMFNGMMDAIKREKLRAAEVSHFMELLVSISPVGIMILDFDRKVTHTNPTMLGILGLASPAETEGKTLDEIPGEMTEVFRALTPGGEGKTVRMPDNMIYRCYLLEFMDMGFRRRFILVEKLTDEIVRAEKETYGKVIRTIAHEVNNTLAGIVPVLELVRDDNPELRDVAESCSERCRSMTEFISGYVSVVKIQDLDLTPVELNKLISDALPFLEVLSAGRAAIRIIPADTTVWVEADQVMMGNVITNIVKNAVESIEQAHRPDGLVSISVTASPATITVTDNGIGVSKEVAGKIFTPFFTNKKTGSGIGLMFVAEVLRRNGCRFSLRTDPLTSLTSFKILFPETRK